MNANTANTANNANTDAAARKAADAAALEVALVDAARWVVAAPGRYTNPGQERITDTRWRRPLKRAIRDVELINPPRALRAPSVAFGLVGEAEVARGFARFPWGICEVRAILVLFPDGTAARSPMWVRD
jgi:hypothetical protein